MIKTNAKPESGAVFGHAHAKAKPPISRTLISQTLAGFVANLDANAMPARIRTRALYYILDAVGIAFASSREDFAKATLAAYVDLGGGSDKLAGDTPVIGMAADLSYRDAAAVNALLVHGLDYDDTHLPGVIHITTSILPCVLSLAARRRSSGADLLTAFIAGVEATGRLAAVAKGGFHQVGFHPTGAVGAFGCALAAGRLLGLNAEQLTMAQGIALSTAAGSMEFVEDGAWTKRIHPGFAAVAGITSATLAKHGFIGPTRAYEGRFGFFPAYLGAQLANADYALATLGLGQTWEIDNIAVKPFPACHFTHGCADAAIALHHSHSFKPENIVEVRALLAAEVVKTVCEPVANKRRPSNGYDGKFSIPFIVATGLIKGEVGLSAFEGDALTDPAVLALADKVNYEIDPASGFPKYYSGEVIVRTKNGGEFMHREQINRGAAERPLSDADIEAKFMENAGVVLSASSALRVRDAVLGLESTADVAQALPVIAGR
jgi:2-methylcitrate dehydratase PrpD